MLRPPPPPQRMTDRLFFSGDHDAIDPFTDGLMVACLWNGTPIVRPVLTRDATKQLLDEWEENDRATRRMIERRNGSWVR